MLLNKESSFAMLMQDHMMCPEDSHAVDEVSWHNMKLASGVHLVHTASQCPCVLKEQLIPAAVWLILTCFSEQHNR